MKKLFGHKIGDTLIEVTLAIGIFSLVAITVVSVINGSTSDAQANLETTVTREAIDTQAEALRFIQSAYISNNSVGDTNNVLNEVWKDIINEAKDPDNDNTQYNVKSCSTIYDDNNKYLINRHAFIIDANHLSSESKNIIIRKASNSSSIFKPATAYPRLYYGGKDNNALLDDGSQTFNLTGAEGIFIVPVKGAKSKIFVNDKDFEEAVSYYDFYIRTCWYDPGADNPSTISTVIRLYDPKAMPTLNVKPAAPDTTQITNDYATVTFFDKDGKDLGMSQTCPKDRDCTISKSYPKSHSHYIFNGWSTTKTCDSVVKVGQSMRFNKGTNELYACLTPIMYTITLKPNKGGEGSDIKLEFLDGTKIKLNNQVNGDFSHHSKPGYEINSWNTKANGTGTIYAGDKDITVNKNMTLYAQWNTKFKIQDFNLQKCRTYAAGGDYWVSDKRDNKKYTVRYVDGACWMSSDLKVEGTKAEPLTVSGSNFTSINSYLSSNSINTGSGDDHLYPVKDGYHARRWTKPISNSNSYNFCAAAAGTSNSCYCPNAKISYVSSSNTTAPGPYYNCTNYKDYQGSRDICPAKWHLPDAEKLEKVAKEIVATPEFNGKDSKSLRYWTKTNAGGMSIYFGYAPPGFAIDNSGNLTYIAGATSGPQMKVIEVTFENGKKTPTVASTSLPRFYYMRIRCVRNN